MRTRASVISNDAARHAADDIGSNETRSLAGVSVVFYSVCDYSSRMREHKEALTLRASGAQVTFVGHGSAVPAHLADSRIPVLLVDPADSRMVGQSSTWGGHLANSTIHRLRRVWWRRTRRNRIVARLVRDANPAVIHAVDAPSLAGAHALARSTGARLVYDVHEYWPGFVSNPVFDQNRRWAMEQLAAEARYAPQADLVLTTSEDMSELLEKRYGLSRVQVLHNSGWAMDAVLRSASSPLRFVFHGSVAPSRNIGGMLEALSQLKGEWTLDLHGGLHGMAREDLEGMAERLGVADRVTVHGSFAYEDLPALLPHYDVELYCANKLDGNFDVTLPNKLFDAIVAGLAVAMPDFRSIRRIVEKERVGVLFDTTDVSSIVAALQPLVTDSSRVTAFKKQAVEASSRYAWEAQGDLLVKAYCEMLDCSLFPSTDDLEQ